MGLYRVFRQSIRFTFRTKRRYLVFLLIFGIVSTIIAFEIDGLDSLQTNDLLEQKGVVIKKAEGAIISYSQSKLLYDNITAFAQNTAETDIESSAIFSYADIDPLLRINSIDVEYPWLSDFANPSLMISGRYPNNINEILLPTGSFQTRNFTVGSSVIQIDTELTVGQKLIFSNEQDEKIELKIVGTFDKSAHGISQPDNQLWMFMDSDMFFQMLDLFGMSSVDAQAYMMSFVVSGVILLNDTYSKTNTLNNKILTLLEDEASFGDWGDIPTSLPLPDALTEANTILVTLGFVVIGGVILSTLFAYLISRFRRREIAILKAMGYTHNSVRMALIGELLTTSISGFIFGLVIAQLILIQLNGIDLGTLIRFQAIGIAFLIMVVISLPGMIFASRKVLGVSPAEAFRDN